MISLLYKKVKVPLKVKKNSIISLGILFFLQFSIFAPPVLGQSLVVFLVISFFSFTYLIFTKKLGKALFAYKADILVISLLIVYSFFWFIVTRDNSYLSKFIIILFCWIVNPYAISYFCVRYKIKLIRLLIILVILNALVSFFQYISPVFNNIIKSIVPQEDRSNPMVQLYDGIRGFGFSSGLFYSYSINLGIIVAMCLNKALFKQKYYCLLIIPILLMGIMINARIGLVPIIVYLIYITIVKFNFKRFLITVSVFIAMYFVIINIASERMFIMLDWTYQIFEDGFRYIIKGEQVEGHFSRLFDTFLVFPGNLRSWIIGTGKYIFTNAPRTSDIGYILQLNYGGILFLFILILFFLVFYFKLKRIISKNNFLEEYSFIPFLFLLTSLLCNYKGDFIRSNVNLSFFSIFYAYFFMLSLKVRQHTHTI